MILFTIHLEKADTLMRVEVPSLRKDIMCPFCKRQGFSRGVELGWPCELCGAVVVGIEESDCEHCG